MARRLVESDYPDMYKTFKSIYFKKHSNTQAGTLGDLCKSLGASCYNSMANYYGFFKNLMDGTVYKRSIPAGMIDFMLRRIGEDYGRDFLERGLRATKEYLMHYWTTRRTSMNKVRRICEAISRETGILSGEFSESIFQ